MNIKGWASETRVWERNCWPKLSVVTKNGSQGSAISFSSFLQFMTSPHSDSETRSITRTCTHKHTPVMETEQTTNYLSDIFSDIHTALHPHSDCFCLAGLTKIFCRSRMNLKHKHWLQLQGGLVRLKRKLLKPLNQAFT